MAVMPAGLMIPMRMHRMTAGLGRSPSCKNHLPAVIIPPSLNSALGGQPLAILSQLSRDFSQADGTNRRPDLFSATDTDVVIPRFCDPYFVWRGETPRFPVFSSSVRCRFNSSVYMIHGRENPGVHSVRGVIPRFV